MPNVVSSAVLDYLGLSRIFWAAASMTALSRHTDAVATSPSGLLKAAEWYQETLLAVSPVYDLYKYATEGTLDTGSFDMLEVTADVKAMRVTRDVLYGQMCDNVWVFLERGGPPMMKRYVDGLVTATNGQRMALNQWFDAVRAQNDAVRDAIDRARRRVYTIRVASEALTAVLGVGTVPLAFSLASGVIYTLTTNLITDWGGMDKADIVVKPRIVAAGQVGAVGTALISQAIDDDMPRLKILQAAEEQKLSNQAVKIARKIEEATARGSMKGVARNAAKIAELADKAASARVSSTMGQALKVPGRIAGPAIALLFMREDLANVSDFISHGEL